MSYRNPIQNVDTQTGQHYRNLIKSISATFGRVAGAYRQDQERINREVERREKENERQAIQERNLAIKLAGDASAALKNGQTLFDKTNMGLLNDSVNYYAGLTTKDFLTQQEIIQSQNIANSPQTIKKDIENMTVMAEGWSKALDPKMLGQMGGFAKGQDPDATTWIRGVIGNTVKGDRFITVDHDQPGGSIVYYNFKPEGSDKVIKYTTTQLRSMMSNPDQNLYITVPNETENMQKMVSDIAMDVIPGTDKKSDKLKDKYYVNQPVKTKEQSGIITSYQQLNEDLLAKDLNTQVISEINSLDPKSQTALYNFFNESSGDKNRADFNDALTPEEFDDLATKYTAYTMAKFVGTGDRVVGTERVDTSASRSKADSQSKANQRAEAIFNPANQAIKDRDASRFVNLGYGKGEISNAKFDVATSGERILTFDVLIPSGQKSVSETKTFNLNNQKDLEVFLNNLTIGKYGEDAITDIAFDVFPDLIKGSGSGIGSKYNK
jgi:hypothetical protein